MFASSSTNQVIIDRKIEAATNESLSEPDWSSNLDIADAINEHVDVSSLVLKTIRRRLAIKQPRVQILSLTLLETCVKNAPRNFQELVSQSDMVKIMVELGTSNKNTEVREKALQLIQDWGEAFKQLGFPAFHEAYMKLRTKGTPFPRRSEGVVLTPSVNPEIVQQRKNSEAAHAEQERKQREELYAEYSELTSVTKKYVERITNECSQVMDYCGLLRDLIINSANEQEIKGNEAIISLVSTLNDVRQRITQLLIELESEVLLELCIQMNENVRNAIEFYSARVKGKQEKPPVFITPYSLKVSAQKSKDKAAGRESAPNNLSLDFAGLQIKAPSPVPPAQSSTSGEGEEDEWEKIAKRKSSTGAIASSSTPSAPSPPVGEVDDGFAAISRRHAQSAQAQPSNPNQPPPTTRSDSLLSMFDPLA